MTPEVSESDDYKRGFERGVVREAARLQEQFLLRIEKLETDTAKLQNDADGLAITYDVLKGLGTEIDALKARVKALEKTNT